MPMKAPMRGEATWFIHGGGFRQPVPNPTPRAPSGEVVWISDGSGVKERRPPGYGWRPPKGSGLRALASSRD